MPRGFVHTLRQVSICTSGIYELTLTLIRAVIGAHSLCVPDMLVRVPAPEVRMLLDAWEVNRELESSAWTEPMPNAQSLGKVVKLCGMYFGIG